MCLKYLGMAWRVEHMRMICPSLLRLLGFQEETFLQPCH